MFLDLVADHEALMDHLPVKPGVTLPLASTLDGDYVARIVRAASIRKFVMLKRDQMYLSRIFEALEAVVPQSAERDDALSKARVAFESLGSGEDVQFHYGDEPPRTVGDVVDDLLNGRFAHSDFTKYQYSNVHRRLGPAVQSLLFWLHAAETVVLKTKASIVEWQRDGTISLGDSVG